jgi:hypothetical protein
MKNYKDIRLVVLKSKIFNTSIKFQISRIKNFMGKLTWPKTLSFIFFLLARSQAPTTCAKNLYCMGCHTEINNICTSCFNLSTGRIKSRALSSQNCRTLNTDLVQDCQYYSGYQKNAPTKSRTSEHCFICHKDFLIWDENSKTITCTDTGIVGCNKDIQHCIQTVCSTNANGVLRPFCRLCRWGFAAAGEIDANGSSTCEEGPGMANCMGEMGTQCLYCRLGYAVGRSG